MSSIRPPKVVIEGYLQSRAVGVTDPSTCAGYVVAPSGRGVTIELVASQGGRADPRCT